MATHSSILGWKIPRIISLAGYIVHRVAKSRTSLSERAGHTHPHKHAYKKLGDHRTNLTQELTFTALYVSLLQNSHHVLCSLSLALYFLGSRMFKLSF